jgi:hypothetical protein
MFNVGDRVMVNGGGPNLRYEGAIQKIAQNEKDEVMYLVMGDGGASPFWQNEEAVYIILKTN